jgi:hypothetical protein
MDEKLLNALSNLSDALTQISDALSEKRSDKDSDVSKALVEGGISDQIKGINEGIKSIKDDTSKILSNQNTILGMAKSTGDKDDLAAKVGGDKNKQSMIKDGLGVILLMAVAIVALGAAFKLIGDVDFGSVIALGIVIPILALSFVEFQKRIKEVEFDPIKDGLVFILTVTAISVAIATSSYILGMVQPIGLPQLLTTVFIAGAFAAISLTIGKLISGFKGVSVTDAIKASLLMPLVLPALSLAIVGSSYFLNQVQPVGLVQLLTSLAISLLFVPLGFAAGMMLKSFKDIDPVSAMTTMILVPIVMIGLSYAVVESSKYLSKVESVGMVQFLTSLAISILFIPLAFSAGLLIKMTKGISLSDMVTVPITMVLMSSAVALSSHILATSTEIEPGKLWNLLLMGMTLSIMSVALGGAMYLLNKMGGVKDFLMGSLAIVIISGAIMVSSHLLSMGDYTKFPSTDWSIGVGLSLLSFGLSTLAFGLVILASGGMGLLAVAGGAVAVMIVAGTIALVSHILTNGNYSEGGYPGVGWSAGVGLSLLTFGLPMMALGTMILLSAGLGLGVMVLGASAISIVANSIVETSNILSTGKYSGGPGLDWTASMVLLMTTFTPALLALGLISAIPFVGGKILEGGKEAIKTVSESIVESSNILSKGNYTGGPTKKWAEGVALSIGAFSKVYSMLISSKAMSFLFGGGVSVEDFSKAIKTISTGISDAAIQLNKGSGLWTGGPTKEWAEGVALSIGAFSKVYKILSENSGIFSSGISIEDFTVAIQTVTHGIIKSAETFNQAGKDASLWLGGPTKEWAEGVSGAIGAFTGVYKVLSDNSGWFSSMDAEDLSNDMLLLTDTMVRVGKKFSDNPNIWGVYPSTDWVSGVRTAIEGMANLISDDKIMSKFKSGGFLGMGDSPIDNMANGMYKMANAYDKLGSSISKFNSSLNQMDLEKVSQFRMLTTNIAILSAMDSEMFGDILDTLEERSSVFAELLKVQYEQDKSRPNVGDTTSTFSVGSNTQSDKTDDLIKRVDVMIKLLSDIKKNSADIEEQLVSKTQDSKKLV